MENTQEQVDYLRIAEAIEYIKRHFKSQPKLEEVAEKVHLSPFHFQRLFTQWAGVSPKKFLQYTSIEYAKALLQKQQLSVFDATIETGLSSTSRLHDLFVRIESMTPGEYKSGGQHLDIHYHFAKSPFGTLLLASTRKGLCFVSFTENETATFSALHQQFPKARFINQLDPHHEKALTFFNIDPLQMEPLTLHLKGSLFQIQVWKALLNIPAGHLSGYAQLAQHIGKPKASRAVGTAIGSNPIAYLIPCHRVILSNGRIGGYRWGAQRKELMIGWEAAKHHSLTD